MIQQIVVKLSRKAAAAQVDRLPAVLHVYGSDQRQTAERAQQQRRACIAPEQRVHDQQEQHPQEDSPQGVHQLPGDPVAVVRFFEESIEAILP